MKVRTGMTARQKAAAAAALAIALGAAVLTGPTPALAATAPSGPATQAAQPAQPARTRAERQVDALLTQYRSALQGTNPNMGPENVRQEFLTEECNARLHAWEEQEHADGVFRAQNIPVSWGTRYEGSGAGHAAVAVVFHWGSGSTTEVWYQVDLATLRISDVTDPPN
jgi:hypothetical protein